MSVGRSSSPRTGNPAAMAPEHTRTISCPCSRTVAISPHSLTSAASSISPLSPVIDDVPILTTVNIPRSPEALDVLELDRPDPNQIALTRAGLRKCALDTHPSEPLLYVRDRFGVREVRHRDHAFRSASGNPPRAVVVAPDGEPLFARPQDGEALLHRFCRLRFVGHAQQRPQELIDAVVRDRGDLHAVERQLRDVGLAPDDETRTSEQIGAVPLE